MAKAITEEKLASQELSKLFETHSRVVFFGGAGVSTASGILRISAARTACTTSSSPSSRDHLVP